MEPRIAEGVVKPAAIDGWTDSPDSPSSEVYKTAKTSPVVLRKASSETLSLNSPDETFISNNNDVKNGDAVPYADGVKFLDDFDDSICSSGSSGSDDDRPIRRPKVPDGGWGWVVVWASLVISMIADGISFSFGLLYIEFLNHFGESKAKTSWIGSLFMAVPLLSGPIMSAFVDRYGCKWMTICGGIISGFGFILACFGNSIEYEYITFGVIAGLGLGLCYVTAVVSITPWFEKYRTLATGLGACGTGIGTFVYAPMTQYFIDEYGWRGTVLLLAGTFFNMCVCGAVMREPEWWTEEQRERREESVAGTKSVRNASSCGSISEFQFPGPDEIKEMIRDGKTPEYVLTTTVQQIREAEANKDKEQDRQQLTFQSVVNLPTYVRQKETVPLEVLQKLRGNGKLFNVILENYPTLMTSRSLSDQGKLNEIGSPEKPERPRVPTMSLRVKKKKTAIMSPPIREDVAEDGLEPHAQPLLESSLPPVIMKGMDKAPRMSLGGFKRQFSFNKEQGAHHYLKNMRVHRNSVMYRGAMLNIPRYRLRASSCPNIFRNSMTTLAKETEETWYDPFLSVCRGVFDFSMFLELHFLLMSISTILLFTWFIVPYFYLADHMVQCKYTEQDGSQVISVVGIFNTIGMIFFGWLGDQPYISVPKAYAFCMLFCGTACIMIPFVSYNWYLVTAAASTFGFFFGGAYSFTPTIVVSLIPLERFTTAYGLILLCQGIGNMIGPPLGGFTFDATGTWEIAFFLSGFWIIVCGVFVGIIPFTKNRRILGTAMLEMDRISNA